MDRIEFYNITDIGNGNEYDFLYNNLQKFQPQYPVQYYRLKGEDEMRLDLVSYKCYGTVQFWWLLGSYNGIKDPFTDMNSGDLFKVPNVLDVYDFYKKYKMS